jgi:hypothetical protein
MKVDKPQIDRPWSLVLLVICALGAFLRVYLFNDQVLIDDEWHGLFYVIGKSAGYLFTHFAIPGATCIPLNLYDWVLLHTTGWSETLLRLPSLVCGIAAVVVLGALARPLVGTQRAAIFSLFIAISPVLVFYSRLSRPYSGVVFFGMAALLLGARWLKTGERRIGVLYVACSVLAIYFHLFAVIAVVAPLLFALLRSLVNRGLGSPVSFVVCGQLAAGMAIACSILVLPALWFSMKTTFFTVAGAGTFQAGAAPKILELLSGTSDPFLKILFWIFFALGVADCWRRDRWLCGLFLALFPLHAIALAISKPDSAQSAMVLVRYAIVLLPVTLLFVSGGVSLAIEKARERFKMSEVISSAIAVVLVLSYLLAGPLPQTYVAPNAFTSHGVYQHQYKTIDWRRSFVSDFTPADFPLDTSVRVREVSLFYGTIADRPNGRPIVEFPMLVGDAFNVLYYYQHFHRRPVFVGYSTNMVLPGGLAGGNVYGNTYVDQILSTVPDHSKLRFQTLVPLHDVAAMRAKQVEFILLHKKYEGDLAAVAPAPELSALITLLEREIGRAFYEDDSLIVFKL